LSLARCAPTPAASPACAAYYGAADPKSGAVDNGPRLFASPACHHRPEVYGGIGERRAGELLRAFFRERRA
jgi:tRNA(adenine34) deaminase